MKIGSDKPALVFSNFGQSDKEVIQQSFATVLGYEDFKTLKKNTTVVYRTGNNFHYLTKLADESYIGWTSDGIFKERYTVVRRFKEESKGKDFLIRKATALTRSRGREIMG